MEEAKTLKGRVSVVLPTLDEAENIDRVLAEVLEAGDEARLDLEVVVVDDGSTDGTRERVNAWARTDARVRLVSRDGERGLAGAVLAGAGAASGEVAVVMDADLSHPAAAIPALAGPVLKGTCDMVLASRYVPGGSTPGWPWRRRALSRAAAVLARLLVDPRDPCSGFFAVRRDTMLEAGAGARGFKIGLEILARSGQELRVEEVPISFRDRERGRSKLGGRVLLAFLAQLTSLAGGAASAGSAVRFAAVGALGLVLDIAVFHALLQGGSSFAVAHLTSFAAATVANYVLNALWAFRREEGHRVTPAGYAAFAVVALLAVALRGGVLAFAHVSLGLTPGAAIIPAVLVAAAVNYLGCAFFVFRPAGGPSSPRISWRVAAVGVAAYLLALRVFYLGEVELLAQEAYYWNYSKHPDLGYLDHPPMVAWLIWLGTQVFGQTELGVRASAIASSLLALFFVFRLTENLLGRAQAYVGALLFAVLPFFFATGFLMTPDAPLVACWAGALYFLERALLAGKSRAWLGAGISIGLGMLSKYTMALVGLAALVYLLIDRPSRRWFRSPAPYAAALAAIFCFSPVIIWNFENDWASFVFQGPRRWNAGLRFHLPALLLYVLALITPLGVAGFIGALRKPARGFLFCLVFTLVPVSVFVVASLRQETKLNWTGPAWLAAIPLIVRSMMPSTGGSAAWSTGRLHVFWKPGVIVLMLFYGALLHHGALGLPGAPGAVGPIGSGWRDLGRQVEEIEVDVIRETGNEPLIVGMDKYNLASLLAFYDPCGDGAGETTSLGLFGKQGLMYDLWFPPGQQAGKSLVLVSDDPEVLDTSWVRDRVKDLEPLHEIRVRSHDGEVAHYFVRVVHAYQPADRLEEQGRESR